MHTQVSILNRVVSVTLRSNWSSCGKIKLIGQTFAVLPLETSVDRLSFMVPEGLHALAFFSKDKGPHQIRSGMTTYLDHETKFDSCMLLAWEEDGKVIVKADNTMAPKELLRFNAFVRSGADILIVDSEHRTVYFPFLSDVKAERNWTYKGVSMDSILEYITRNLTLDELDERAISEQKLRDEIVILSQRVASLQISYEQLSLANASLEVEGQLADVQIADLEKVIAQLEDERDSEKAYREKAIGLALSVRESLSNSKALYNLLMHLPLWLRPKMCNGFIEATDTINTFANP
jgi:hypothetical protein